MVSMAAQVHALNNENSKMLAESCKVFLPIQLLYILSHKTRQYNIFNCCFNVQDQHKISLGCKMEENYERAQNHMYIYIQMFEK